MKGSLMTRATYAYGLSALALLVVIAGCSTSSKTVTGGQAAQFQVEDFSSWGNLTRTPADDSENAVGSVVLKSTENVDSVYVPVAKKPVTVYGKACGLLIQGESSHTALNNEDANYFLKLNCATVKNAASKKGYVRFAEGSIKKGQKGYLTRWKRQAILDNSGVRGAVPYVCFQGQVTVPLCNGSSTSTVVSVNNFTSKHETVFKTWKE